MDIEPEQIRRAVAAHLDDAREFLCDLVRTPSLPGEESAVTDVVAGAFARVAEVQRVEMTNTLRDDPDYSDPIPGIDYTRRSNLRVAVPGAGGGRTLLLNTHLDTVPPSQGQPDPYVPHERDGSIWGRGSCDAKGQVATVYLAMAAVAELGMTLPGDLIAHLVAEEEVGGNGTLAMVRAGERADGCIVLEPCDFKVLTSIRGAVWFRVTLTGRPGHPGRSGLNRSALDMAIRVVEILRGYHDRLLAESRGHPLFDRYDNPMPLTVGKLHAGNWPATAPGEAVLEGVLGLLPNKTAEQVMAEMTAAIAAEGGPEIADNFAIHFMYRHDASETDPAGPLPAAVLNAARAFGVDAPVDAMTASCDACFYNNILSVPTLVFGGGSLSVAHSNAEHMPVADLARAAEVLTAAAIGFCGGQP